MIIKSSIKPASFWGLKRRHILIAVLFFLISTTMAAILIWQSDSYQEARRFAQEDSRILAATGAVSAVSFKLTGEWAVRDSDDGGSSHYTFNIRAANGDFTLEIYLYSRTGVWRERVAYLRNVSSSTILTIRGE